MLEIRNLEVKIDNKEILKGVNLEIQPGEVVALMGPNGSGKSSLANALMGHPSFTVSEDSQVKLEGKDLLKLTPDERARLGLFLAFQYPVALGGVTVREVLLSALRQRETGPKVSALELRQKIEAEALKLSIAPELLKRDLNEGFSGGEKKKMEILQLRILQPKYAVLDETDSGLDIDALKVVAQGAKMAASDFKMGILVITHYQRLLKYLEPARVIILSEGCIVAQGGREIVDELESSGYQQFIKTSLIA